MSGGKPLFSWLNYVLTLWYFCFNLNEKFKNNHKIGIILVDFERKNIKTKSKFDVVFGFFALLSKKIHIIYQKTFRIHMTHVFLLLF
jgi:hypothetical protein